MKQSEELAKLLGIEPKSKFTCLNCGSSPMASNEHCISCGSFNLKTIERYPDFTEPSNFLLLWEMSDENDRKQFIDLLIEFMKNNTYQDIDDYYTENYQKAEEYKQQAQQTEWNY